MPLQDTPSGYINGNQDYNNIWPKYPAGKPDVYQYTFEGIRRCSRCLLLDVEGHQNCGLPNFSGPACRRECGMTWPARTKKTTIVAHEAKCKGIPLTVDERDQTVHCPLCDLPGQTFQQVYKHLQKCDGDRRNSLNITKGGMSTFSQRKTCEDCGFTFLSDRRKSHYCGLPFEVAWFKEVDALPDPTAQPYVVWCLNSGLGYNGLWHDPARELGSIDPNVAEEAWALPFTTSSVAVTTDRNDLTLLTNALRELNTILKRCFNLPAQAQVFTTYWAASSTDKRYRRPNTRNSSLDNDEALEDRKEAILPSEAAFVNVDLLPREQDLMNSIMEYMDKPPGTADAAIVEERIQFEDAKRWSDRIGEQTEEDTSMLQELVTDVVPPGAVADDGDMDEVDDLDAERGASETDDDNEEQSQRAERAKIPLEIIKMLVDVTAGMPSYDKLQAIRRITRTANANLNARLFRLANVTWKVFRDTPCPGVSWRHGRLPCPWKSMITFDSMHLSWNKWNCHFKNILKPCHACIHASETLDRWVSRGKYDKDGKRLCISWFCREPMINSRYCGKHEQQAKEHRFEHFRRKSLFRSKYTNVLSVLESSDILSGLAHLSTRAPSSGVWYHLWQNLTDQEYRGPPVYFIDCEAVLTVDSHEVKVMEICILDHKGEKLLETTIDHGKTLAQLCALLQPSYAPYVYGIYGTTRSGAMTRGLTLQEVAQELTNIGLTQDSYVIEWSRNRWDRACLESFLPSHMVPRTYNGMAPWDAMGYRGPLNLLTFFWLLYPESALNNQHHRAGVDTIKLHMVMQKLAQLWTDKQDVMMD